MKKLLILAVCLLGTIACSQANAGLFAAVVNAGNETVEPTAKYEMDTYGYDVRIYEWIPKANKEIRCVFVAGSKNSSGVACYPIKKK